MRGRRNARDAGQQVVVSGVGGQGVLFVTRLLGDAAIGTGRPVLTSETHGMAQRGGVVVSHLKVGPFASPLVRAGRADGLIVLKEENLALHRPFLAPAGWVVVNAATPPREGTGGPLHHLDADGLAVASGIPRAVNLVLLGFALARRGGRRGAGLLFCSPDEVRTALGRRLAGRDELLEASLRALDLGILHGKG